MRSALAVSLLTLSILAVARPSSSSAGEENAAPPAGPRVTLDVSFKLDPRLSGPTYGGERWVSPKTFTGASAQGTVEVKARAVDAKGRPIKIAPAWRPSDPEMVTVSPARGEQVRITVKRAGESSLTVTSGGASKKLTVKAVETNGRWQVAISQ